MIIYHTAVYSSMVECNTVLSAYTMYRHLGWYCTHPLLSKHKPLLQIYVPNVTETQRPSILQVQAFVAIMKAITEKKQLLSQIINFAPFQNIF